MPKPDTPTLFQAAPLPIAVLGVEEQIACLRLIRSENVGAVTFRALINQFGGASRALEALPELSRRGGSRRDIVICTQAAAEAELAAADTAGARPIFTIEPGYPAVFAATDAPPPMLYVKGDCDFLNRSAVAIVGSRQCSAAGSKIARLFATELSEAGYIIVSGLARGIDRVAHEASLARGTVAVVAGGIDKIYPPEHGELFARIAFEGCIVTERPPGFIAREKDFPRRNRIIAGISLGVVVIEAAARSGTLVTARYANEQGREVFAVPGHPLDPRAEGTNGLIKAGATMVTSPDDVLEILAPIAGLRAPRAAPFQGAPESEASLCDVPPSTDVGEAECNAVLATLGPAPTDIDALVRATGLSPRDVQVAVLELALAGRITRTGTGMIARLTD